MKLSTRLAVAMVALAVLTAAAVGFITYRDVEKAILSSEIERQQANIRLVAEEFELRMRAARGDIVGFRSAVALAGIVRAATNGGVDPVDGASLAEWNRRFAQRLTAELGAKPNYLQFRIIGLANDGREILRVDREGKDGTIRVVPDAELQQKGGRAYFEETVAEPRGSVYISPLELNREHGAIEVPHVPVMRVGTPIYTAEGKAFGILIINLDLRPAFAAIRKNVRPGNKIYLVNERGDFLIHPDRQREFGFDLGKRYNWKDEMPELAAALGPDKGGVRVVRTAGGDRIVGAVASVRLAGGPLVSVIETAPYPLVMAAALSVQRSTLMVGLAAILAAALLAMFFARTLTRPLVQMTRAVEDFGRGKPMQMPSDAGGEIGTLARAFQRMADEVQQTTAALKREAEERERVFETSLDLILVTDKRGNFIRVSPSSQTILGYRPDEMLGHNGTEFLFPEDLDKRARGNAQGAARPRDAQLRDTLRPQGRPRGPAVMERRVVGAGAAAFLHRPRHDGAHQARTAIAPIAEDGRRRPAHRRRRPRLQQYPHRHHRHDRDSGRGRRGRPGAQGNHRIDRRGGATRRAIDPAASRLRAPAAAGAETNQSESIARRHHQDAAAAARRAHRDRHGVGAAGVAGHGRSVAALHGADQSRRQRARRHARWRQADAGDRQCRARRNLRAGAQRSAAGQLCDDRRERHRHRCAGSA